MTTKRDPFGRAVPEQATVLPALTLDMFANERTPAALGKTATPVDTPRGLGPPLLASDEILRIARLDAERAYHDLSGYRIAITQEADGWHVDFELKDASLNGGGPHYVIDAATGAILAKRYEQ